MWEASEKPEVFCVIRDSQQVRWQEKPGAQLAGGPEGTFAWAAGHKRQLGPEEGAVARQDSKDSLPKNTGGREQKGT